MAAKHWRKKGIKHSVRTFAQQGHRTWYGFVDQKYCYMRNGFNLGIGGIDEASPEEAKTQWLALLVVQAELLDSIRELVGESNGN